MIVVFGLWQWMLGCLLVGALVQAAYTILFKFSRKLYQASFIAAVVMVIAWLTIIFWARCLEFEKTSSSSAMHIGPQPATFSFGWGVFAALIGGGVVIAVRKIRNSCLGGSH